MISISFFLLFIYVFFFVSGPEVLAVQNSLQWLGARRDSATVAPRRRLNLVRVSPLSVRPPWDDLHYNWLRAAAHSNQNAPVGFQQALPSLSRHNTATLPSSVAEHRANEWVWLSLLSFPLPLPNAGVTITDAACALWKGLSLTFVAHLQLQEFPLPQISF